MDEDPSKIIDLPGQFLDKAVEVLAKVGIDLPVIVLQLFLFLLVLIALIVALRAVFPNWRSASVLALLTAATLVLIEVGIVFGIAAQAVLPDRFGGRVGAADLSNVHVELLDFRGDGISTGGSVDSQTGEFFAYYKPLWYGRARTLRITAEGCKAQDRPIPRGQLAAAAAWEFTCEKV